MYEGAKLKVMRWVIGKDIVQVQEHRKNLMRERERVNMIVRVVIILLLQLKLKQKINKIYDCFVFGNTLGVRIVTTIVISFFETSYF